VLGVPPLLNVIEIFLLNFIYSKLVTPLTNFENHRLLSSYENSIIAKYFLFVFTNTFLPTAMIAFLSSGELASINNIMNLQICNYNATSANCYAVLQIYVITIYVFYCVKNLGVMLTPIVKIYLLNKNTPRDECPVIHPFLQIDTFIDRESIA